MEEKQEFTSPSDSSTKKGIKSEMVVALAAIVVGVMTMCVYIFQARIMMEQQHTSVWPYVEWTTTYMSEDSQEFYISVINKGVGPALIKDTKLSLDDKQYTHYEYRDFMKDLLGEETRDSLWIMYAVIDNRVMAPGEEVKIFHVKNWHDTRIPVVDYSRYRYEICYCSIYHDCWTTEGTTSVEGLCK